MIHSRATSAICETGLLVALAASMVPHLCGCAPDRPSEQIVRPGQYTEERHDKHKQQDAGTVSSRNRQTKQARQPGELQETVAVVNGEAITRGQFEANLGFLPEYARVRYRTLQARQSLLETVIHTEAMADIAERRDLGSSGEAHYAMQHELTRQALARAIERRVTMEGIDESAIESYFEKHREEFWFPERRRLAILVTGSRERAKQIRRAFLQEHADAATKKRVAAFRRIAARSSVHRTLPNRGGDPGVLYPPDHAHPRAEGEPRIGDRETRSQWAKVAFRLAKPGEVSSVFECDGATSIDDPPVSHRWCLAMLIEIQPPEQPAYDEVSREIRSKLYNQRVEALRTTLLEKWRDSSTVRIKEAWHRQAGQPTSPPTLEEIPLERDSSENATAH